MNAFDLTVNALREQGLNSDEILQQLSQLFEFLKTADETKFKDEVDFKTRIILKKVGVGTNLKGYEYWIEAIKIYKNNKNVSMSKELYPQIAGIFGVKSSKVQESMRHAVKISFARCPTEVVNQIFGEALVLERRTPTVKEFLSALADQI